MRVVLVHGGGPEISEMLKRVGKETVFVDGLRYTDEETAEIVRMVLAARSINRSSTSSKASAARRSACAGSTAT